MQNQIVTLDIPKNWQPHIIPAEEAADGSLPGSEPYTWFVRRVGPWRLEVFPPEPDGQPGTRTAAWTGQWELEGGRLIEADAPSLAEAAGRIEQMMATALASLVMDLVGGSLPDSLWETAVTLAES